MFGYCRLALQAAYQLGSRVGTDSKLPLYGLNTICRSSLSRQFGRKIQKPTPLAEQSSDTVAKGAKNVSNAQKVSDAAQFDTSKGSPTSPTAGTSSQGQSAASKSTAKASASKSESKVQGSKSKPSFRERLEKLRDSREAATNRDKRLVDPEERLDPQSDAVTKQELSYMHLSPQRLPKKVEQRITAVFAKYPHSELRKMGLEYLKFYQMLHATEKPVDITKFEKNPFQNTTDLYREAPNLVWQMSGRKTASEFYRLLKEKEAQEEKEAQKEKIKTKSPEETTIGDRLTMTRGERKVTTETDPIYSLIQYDENMAIAYLVRKFPETFANIIRVLIEIKYRFPNEEIKSALDFGAGLGGGAIAYADLFPSIEFIANVEPSDAMRRLGKYISQDYKNLAWVRNLSETMRFDQHQTFDVVSVLNVLEEIPTPEQRITTLEDLWKKVRPGGFLVVLEPGSPMGFRFINDTRNLFLSKSREEANIVAPCPHQLACPLAAKEGSWCNFEQKWERYPKSVLSKEPSEHMDKLGHFSYLVIKKGPIVTSSLEAKTIQQQSLFWPRLMRPTLIRKGHVVLDLCTPAGEIDRRMIAKCHNEDELAYKHARKMIWGDLWPFAKRIPNRYRKTSKFGKRLW